MKRVFQDSETIPVLVSEDGKVLTDGTNFIYYSEPDAIWVYESVQGELGQVLVGSWGQEAAVINITSQGGTPDDFEVTYQGITATSVDGVLTPEPALYTE